MCQKVILLQMARHTERCSKEVPYACNTKWRLFVLTMILMLHWEIWWYALNVRQDCFDNVFNNLNWGRFVKKQNLKWHDKSQFAVLNGRLCYSNIKCNRTNEMWNLFLRLLSFAKICCKLLYNLRKLNKMLMRYSSAQMIFLKSKLK